MAIALPFFKKKIAVELAPYGGGIRPHVLGPASIKSLIGRLALIRATLTATLVVVLVINGLYIARLTRVMDTQLYVADGTPFSCPVDGI